MTSRTLATSLCALLLLAALAVCAVRGPARTFQRGLDLDMTPRILGAKAWIRGLNPYDAEATRPLLEGRVTDWQPLVGYPPTTFVVVAPIAALPWPVVRVVWIAGSILLAAAAAFALLRLAGLRIDEPRGMLLLAGIAALAPLHTALAVGQPAVPAIALGILGLGRLRGKRALATGLLIGLATALKPQLGGVFLAYLVVTARWRAGAIGIGLVVLIAAVGAGRLWALGFDWVHDMRSGVETFVGGTSYRDDPKRFQLVNLHVLLHQFTASIPAVRGLVFAFTAAGALAFVALYWRTRGRANELLALSVPIVLSLLAIYHRAYDAFLLAVPLAWAVRTWGRGPVRARTRAPLLVILLCVPFLLPGGAMLAALAARGHVPEAVTQSWPWRALLLPHQTWALLGLLAVLTLALAREDGSRSAS